MFKSMSTPAQYLEMGADSKMEATLEQWFSNLNGHQQHLEGLLANRSLTPSMGFLVQQVWCSSLRI